MAEVERQLDCPEMDAIDQALGRPIDPLKAYRSYVVHPIGSPEYERLCADSDTWRLMYYVGKSPRKAVFVVTDASKRQLKQYLEARA